MSRNLVSLPSKDEAQGSLVETLKQRPNSFASYCKSPEKDPQLRIQPWAAISFPFTYSSGWVWGLGGGVIVPSSN